MGGARVWGFGNNIVPTHTHSQTHSHFLLLKHFFDQTKKKKTGHTVITFPLVSPRRDPPPPEEDTTPTAPQLQRQGVFSELTRQRLSLSLPPSLDGASERGSAADSFHGGFLRGLGDRQAAEASQAEQAPKQPLIAGRERVKPFFFLFFCARWRERKKKEQDFLQMNDPREPSPLFGGVTEGARLIHFN